MPAHHAMHGLSDHMEYHAALKLERPTSALPGNRQMWESPGADVGERRLTMKNRSSSFAHDVFG